jgi:hypothetical protein
MTRLQKLRKDNKQFEYCHNCERWYDLRDLNKVAPHLVCNEKRNLLTGMDAPKFDWTKSICLNSGEIYNNPDPVTHPLLKKTVDRSLLRKMNLRLKLLSIKTSFNGMYEPGTIQTKKIVQKNSRANRRKE